MSSAPFGEWNVGGAISALRLDPASRRLAVCSYDHPHQHVVVFALEPDGCIGGELWRKREEYSDDLWIAGLAFSAGGERLWVAHRDGRLHAYGADGVLVRTTPSGGGESSSAVALERHARFAVYVGSYEDGHSDWGGGSSRNVSFEVLLPAEEDVPTDPSFDGVLPRVTQQHPLLAVAIEASELLVAGESAVMKGQLVE